MRTAATLAVGLLAFAVAGAYFAPARLLALGVAPPLRVWNMQGSVWRGMADLRYDGANLGRLAWSFRPAALFDGRLAADWQLNDAGHHLAGDLALGLHGIEVSAAGVIGKGAIDGMLRPYRIDAAGALSVERFAVALLHDLRPVTTTGRLSWNGGSVRYRLAGAEYAAMLPAMAGTVELQDGELTLAAHANQDPTPLIRLRLDREGWAHVGITRRLTELAGLPWPAEGPADAIVIEVSELVLAPPAADGHHPAVPGSLQ